MHFDRALFPKLLSEFKRKEITILLGPRQVGKTYLLKQLKETADARGISSSFFNLEDPAHLLLFNQPPEKIYRLLTESGKIIFIDEFHYLKNASQLFKAVYDSGKGIKIFASGSSSVEIHKHLKESLAGRRRVIRVFPLSYAEIVSKMGERATDYYLSFGGLPGAAVERSRMDRIDLLNEILQAYLIKDIKSLVKEENIRAFNMLLYLLAQSQGSLVSVHNLAAQIGLTPMSIHRYLDIMEATYILTALPSYSRNMGNELRKSKKYYLYDIGIRNALLKNFRKFTQREDQGFILESAVFLNLAAHLKSNEELQFWRTRDGEEVDFVLVTDQIPMPIEVKSRLKHMEIPNGIRAFLRRYPKTKKAIVLNTGVTGQLRMGSTQIIFSDWKKSSSILEKS